MFDPIDHARLSGCKIVYAHNEKQTRMSLSLTVRPIDKLQFMFLLVLRPVHGCGSRGVAVACEALGCRGILAPLVRGGDYWFNGAPRAGNRAVF